MPPGPDSGGDLGYGGGGGGGGGGPDAPAGLDIGEEDCACSPCLVSTTD